MRIRVALAVTAGVLAVSCGSSGPPMASEASSDGVLTLSVSVSGPGRVMSIPPAIDCPGTCVGNFPQGSSVTLAASALGEGQFMSWSGDCMGAMGCFVSMEREAQVIAIFGMGMPMMLEER